MLGRLLRPKNGKSLLREMRMEAYEKMKLIKRR